MKKITDFISDNWKALAPFFIPFLTWALLNYKIIFIPLLISFIALLIIGILSWQEKANVKTIERNKRMKREMERELKKPFDPSKNLIGPETFNCHAITVKDVYKPERLKPRNEYYWSPKRVEPVYIRDDGFVVIFGNVSDKNKAGKEITMHEVGLIPFKKIKSWDANTDSGRPVFYCKYSGKFGPFSKIDHIPTKKYSKGTNPFLLINI